MSPNAAKRASPRNDRSTRIGTTLHFFPFSGDHGLTPHIVDGVTLYLCATPFQNSDWTPSVSKQDHLIDYKFP